MKNWLIVLTFFGLWISTMFNSEIQQYLAYGLILSVGVLHGANDITLIKFTSLYDSKKLSINKILGYYMLTVVLIIGIFTLYPPLALGLFILISSYHFGEQHLKGVVLKDGLISKGFYFFYGLTILFMIFNFNLNKTAIIVQEVTGFLVPEFVFKYVLILGLIGLTVFYLVLAYQKRVQLNIFSEVFHLLILMIVFRVADLLWGFAIYFVLWHSIPSLKDQIEVLYGDKESVLGLKKYLKASWIYWLISLSGLALLYFFFKNDSEFFVTILIYFLAAITFPHVIVMSRLEKT